MPPYTTDAARGPDLPRCRSNYTEEKQCQEEKLTCYPSGLQLDGDEIQTFTLTSASRVQSIIPSSLFWQRRQQLGTCSGRVVNNRMSLGVSQCRVSRDTAGITFERLKERMHTATGAYNPSVRVIRHQGETRKQCGGTSSAATSQGRATASAFAQIGPQRVH